LVVIKKGGTQQQLPRPEGIHKVNLTKALATRVEEATPTAINQYFIFSKLFNVSQLTI